MNKSRRRKFYHTRLYFTGLSLAALALHSNVKAEAPRKSPRMSASAPAKRLLASDIMATVEGEPISRRELAHYWIEVDTRTNGHLGELVTDQWKAAKGLAASYTITESAIFQKLFTDPNIEYAPILSSLVNSKIVEIEAKRKGIIITETQTASYSHELWNQVRQQHNTTMTDEQLMGMYKLPKDVFKMDMRTKLLQDRLLAADISRKNGHPLSPDDWIFTRELFAAASSTTKSGENPTDQDFLAAKTRLEAWVKEMQAGKTMEEAAREHNEDFTRTYGGLRGPSLRGTGTKALEDAIWGLKGMDYSIPLRGKLGWYIFRIERRGSQTTDSERKQLWKQISGNIMPTFLTTLRKSAKLTSVVVLPENPPPTSYIPSLDEGLGQPPGPPQIPGK